MKELDFLVGKWIERKVLAALAPLAAPAVLSILSQSWAFTLSHI